MAAIRWHGSGAQTQGTAAAALKGVSDATTALSASIQADPANTDNLVLTDNDNNHMALLVPGQSYPLGSANPASDSLDITTLKMDAVSGTQTYRVAWRS